MYNVGRKRSNMSMQKWHKNVKIQNVFHNSGNLLKCLILCLKPNRNGGNLRNEVRICLIWYKINKIVT